MRLGERIVAVKGSPIRSPQTTESVWRGAKPGDLVQLTIERPRQAAPVVLTGIFRRRSPKGHSPCRCSVLIQGLSLSSALRCSFFVSKIRTSGFWRFCLEASRQHRDFQTGWRPFPLPSVHDRLPGLNGRNVRCPVLFLFCRVSGRSPLDRRLGSRRDLVRDALPCPGTADSGRAGPCGSGRRPDYTRNSRTGSCGH